MLHAAPVVWTSPPEANAELAARVRDGLSVLSARERRAMILHYLEGRSCAEIAADLGLTTGSVKRILYYSRRKVRKECDEMAETEKETKGPRECALWLSGEMASERWNTVFYGFSPLIGSICLAVNKRPKTVDQIAAEVECHPRYVAAAVDQLSDLKVLEAPRKGRYLLNFILFDGEDWRRLYARVRQPAAEAAHRMAQAEARLRAAFAETPLAAAGWEWQDVAWVVYG